MSKNKKPLYAVKNGKTCVAITTGHQARTLVGPDGKRRAGPVRVSIQMLMSSLSVNAEELTICLYTNSPKDVITSASEILKRFYRSGKSLASEGYPKPSGEGTLELLEDRDFQALYRDAKREAAGGNHDLRVLGPKDDPTAFHIVRRSTKIITSGGRL